MPFALLAGDIAAFAYQRLRPRDTFPMTVGEILGSNEDSSEYVLGDLSTAVQRFGGRLAIDPDGPQPALVRANIDNRLVTVDYRAARAGWLALHQFAFTGWQCRIDGANWFSAESYQPGAASVSRSKPGGLVPMCRVPAGAHRLEARLPRPSSEEWGIRISLCGIAAVLLALLTGRRFRDDGIPGGRAA
jgi:hypothetical protein